MDRLDLICKFVYLGDKEIGETIDIYEEKLIVKMGAKFAAIPLQKIERVDGEKVYLSAYDEKRAFEDGKKWEDEKSKPVSIEELKIFGFGEESKNRFSVILKEIGEYEEGAGVDEANERAEKVEERQRGQKDERTESEEKDKSENEQTVNKANEESEISEGESEGEIKPEKAERKLGEGIIDKL
ncbi:MAG: hypothetical protein H0Z28_07210 [Archaeoglobus sp.]|nr:hypothetical protein [Archaeoglobus sp.]